MGSGRSVKKQTTSPKDIIDYLDELFAYALAIGMTYEQYWYDEPKLINAYIKAEEIKTIKRNNEMWLQGLYNHISLNTSLSNALSKHSHAKYPEQPIPITQRELDEREEQRVKKIFNKLQALANANKKKQLGG